ncbi:MAG: hypothetical protein AAB877_03220, partial [Patescibacteria group bacterium]
MNVTGEFFISTSVVKIDGSSIGINTTVNSDRNITANIAPSVFTNGGTHKVTVYTPGTNGGTSDPFDVNVNNPIPATLSLSPSAVAVNPGNPITVTVNGTGFVTSSIVKVATWPASDTSNNSSYSNRTTTFQSSNKLIAQLPVSDFTALGYVAVKVFNPLPGGGWSANFLIITIGYPPPILLNVSPPSTTVNNPDFNLTVTGSTTGPEFQAGFFITIDNNSRPTTFVDARHLKANIPVNYFLTAGIRKIGVNCTGNCSIVGAVNQLDFAVNNPVPNITAIAPNPAVAGTNSFDILGSGFVSGSIVKLNGSTSGVVSNYQNSGKIQAFMTPSVGAHQVTVTNPPPVIGTGISSPFTLNINPSIPSNPTPTI